MIACTSLQKKVPILKWETYDSLPSLNGLPSLGYAGAVIGVHNNHLLIGGGANFPEALPWLGGKKMYYDKLFVRDLRSTHSQFDTFPLPSAQAYSANVSTSQGVISIGGENPNGILKNVMLLQCKDGKVYYIHLPQLPLALTNAATCIINDVVYVAGGETADSVSSEFLKLDLKNIAKGWHYLAKIPHGVSHTVLVASESKQKIYLAGGRAKIKTGISNLYKNTFEYDVRLNEWNEKAPLPYALSAGTGALLNNDFIALFGGDKGTVFTKTEQLISAIAQEKDTALKASLIEEKAQLQSQHPGFMNQMLVYRIDTDEWLPAVSIPFSVGVTTTAVKQGKNIWIPSGEVKPGIRSKYILKATVQY